MNARRFRLTPALSIALALAVPALAAPPSEVPPPADWAALEARGSVVTLSGLDRDGIVLLLGAAQRLTVDPASGNAVAELLPDQLPLLRGLRVESLEGGASQARFADAEARAFAPRPEADGSAPRLLRKVPSSRVVTPGTAAPAAPAARFRGHAPETSCLFEGFEELPVWWEDGGPWFHFEGGRDNAEGDYFWLDEDCTAATGSWSACAVFGGDYGSSLACFDSYDYATDSWMKYAYWIDCIAGYSSAQLKFAMTLQSETDYDTFGYYCSVDDINYFGYYYSGDFSDYWYAVTQDLRNFYGLGNLTAYPAFALAFNFYADGEVELGWGAFVDDIAITFDQIRVDSVSVARNPFRLKVWGANFQPGAWVYIDGQPVPAVKFKNTGLLVAKKGRALKDMVMVGREVCIQVLNPNGNTAACYYWRY